MSAPALIQNAALAERMRASAQSGLTAANERIVEVKARKPNTYKRVSEAKHALKQAWEDWMASQTLANLADAAEAGTLPATLADLKTWKAVPRKFIASEESRKALGPFIPERPTDELLFKVWDLVGSKIPGFFPTPLEVINQLMGLYSDNLEGLRVLEPSAGSGNIADWLRESGAVVDCAERNYTLYDILTLKGHNMVSRDALEIVGTYPLIVMNPPFEKLQDAEHVRHAFVSNLAPGGTLLAIIGGGTLTGTTKKHLDFQQWFRSLGGHWERLPAGAFEESGTNVATTMIVLQKPEEETDDAPTAGELLDLAYDDALADSPQEPKPDRTTSLQALPPHERPLDIAAMTEPAKGIIPMLLDTSKARRLRWWTEEFGDRTEELRDHLKREPEAEERYNYMRLVMMHARADDDDRKRTLAATVALAMAKGKPIPLEVLLALPDVPAHPEPTNLPTEATEAPERPADEPGRPLLEGRPWPVPDDLPDYATSYPDGDPFWSHTSWRYQMDAESVSSMLWKSEAGIGLGSGTGRYNHDKVIQWNGTLWICTAWISSNEEDIADLWRIVPVSEPIAQQVLAALPEKRQGYHGVLLGVCNFRGTLTTPQFVVVGPPVRWVYTKTENLQTGSSPEASPEVVVVSEPVPKVETWLRRDGQLGIIF